jgi:hypothetical protein
LFQEDEKEKPESKRAERIVVYIIFWVVLAVPGGILVYDLFSSPPWTQPGASYGIGMFAFGVWLFIASLFIAPPLTSRLVYMLYPAETRAPRPVRKLVDEFFSDALDLLKALSHYLRIILLAWWVGYIVPMGVITALILGGWFYFIPFLAANILIGYKFNKAKNAQKVEAYDDKNFASYEKSFDEYLSLVEKAKRREERRDNQ